MRWPDIFARPTAATLRQFAALWLVFFAGLGSWHGGWHGNWLRAWIEIGLAVTVGLAGLVYPRAVRPLFVAWMCLAFPLAWLVTHALLAAMFYGVLTPVGLFFRLIGRDVLALRRPRGYDTYWVAKPAADNIESYVHPS